MNNADTRARIIAIIKSIAPEIDETTLRDDQPLRDQIDLDSMDWLNIIIAAHEKLHVDIPETDYGKLRSLNAWIAYVHQKTGEQPAS